MTMRRAFALILVVSVAGCTSPEDGRVRGGGRGGDGGNSPRGGIHVPSKIDGTRPAVVGRSR